MERWEYGEIGLRGICWMLVYGPSGIDRMHGPGHGRMLDFLNQCGEIGWEVCASREDPMGNTYIVKRRLM